MLLVQLARPHLTLIDNPRHLHLLARLILFAALVSVFHRVLVDVCAEQ